MCRAATVRAASSAELSLSLRSPRAPGVRSSAGSARGAHRPQLLNRVQHVALLLQTDEPRGEVVDLRCRRERREDAMPVVTEVPLPACKPDAPVSFVRHHPASGQPNGAASSDRLLLRVVAAQPNDPAPLEPLATIGYRRASLEASGLYLVDSLSPGPDVLYVRAFGFMPVRDSINVRAGYVDTITVGLVEACR